MMRHDPQGFPPFGDDEDANRRLTESLGLIGQLAQASTKLDTMKTPNLNARAEQKAYVADLRSELRGRAERAGIDVDEFIEAGRKELEKRLRRKVIIPIVQTAARVVDDEEARLQVLVHDAEIAEEKTHRIQRELKARFDGAQKRFDAACDAADRARAALATYRTTRKVAA
jgi:hypothetical protein